ncbi:MAG: NAD-dependent epimerase/dehydratase family protein, partial [Microgenomates group bacterium]
MNLKNKKILITGASFIGIHLIEKLINENVKSIRVVNLTNKSRETIKKKFSREIEFYHRDLRDISQAKKSIKGMDIVFHLAADHGGRGYVALRQGNTSSNFLLDGAIFKACLDEEVEKIFYASSGCVYPNYLQNTQDEVYLKENDVKAPYDADNIYGWAKLMGELTLKTYYKDFGLKSAIGRFFTVYGPYAKES